MQHLIEEGNEMLSEAEDPAIDALMIAAAQKVEHYEIAAYGTMRTWANRLGKADIAAVFETTLEEEKEADRKLTEIAESLANDQAAEGGEAEEEETAAPKRGTVRGRAASMRRQTAADRSRRRR
jgi:ferritin-like metal-binding protein YciE